MNVVSDTSPLCYLAWIQKQDLLPTLFGEVLIPTAVLDELMAAETPLLVRRCYEPIPSWLIVRTITRRSDRELLELHPGEREAIFLAEEIGVDLILLDDRDARRTAIDRGLRLTGLLGVLEEAAERRLLDLPEAVEALRATSFRASPSLLKSILERHPATEQ